MSDVIVSVKNLSKVYNLYDKTIDRVKEVLIPWKSWHRSFYALSDISFELEKGEHLGILGVNGAGKSTLLQLLTGVLAPSSGTVQVNGNVAALLELGAGLNANLTGRENARFLLSMSIFDSKELEKKVEEVERFADIGDFFDQPIKLYSSGMMVRVAFAANIASDPDLLIVDEALAVGDVRFQKKCYDYIAHLKNKGVTFILVTHDSLGAKNFCNRLFLLHQGRLIADGEPADVVTKYYQLLYPNETRSDSIAPEPNAADTKVEGRLGEPAQTPSPGAAIKRKKSATDPNGEYVYVVKPDHKHPRWGAGGVVIEEVRLHGLSQPNILRGNKLCIECDYRVNSDQIKQLCDAHHVEPNFLVGMRLDTASGLTLFDLGNAVIGDGRNVATNLLREKSITVLFTCTLPDLYPGNYFLTPAISLGVLSHFISVCGYDNLVLFVQEQQKTILGVLRPDYEIERVN